MPVARKDVSAWRYKGGPGRPQRGQLFHSAASTPACGFDGVRVQGVIPMDSERRGACFPKHLRLLVANDYVPVLRRAEVNLSSGPLRVRAIANKMRCARLGLIVPKRGNPLAVRRNRIKRIVREIFRHEADQLPALDLVVQVHGQLTDEELRDRLLALLARIKRMMTEAGEHSRGADGSHE